MTGVGLLEGLATTRAIRRFRPDPVCDDDLAAILFAATRAPSGTNRQPFRFLVLRDGPMAAEAKGALGEAFRAAATDKVAVEGYRDAPGEDSPTARFTRSLARFVERFEDIPVVVLACLVRHRAPDPYEGASIYPACQNLLLAARARGLGGVMTNWHLGAEDRLRRILAIPDGVALSACIPLGHPEGRHGPVRRRPLRDLVYEDRWEGGAPWAIDPPGTRFSSGARR
ncbi:MAG: nitroreductase family protein [Actinomycetota bacterium]|nr:nitroreductase family protein [Actinomycetota bacterium]